MGMFAAQSFLAMRNKINDDQPAAGPQDTSGFGDYVAWRIRVMQYLMNSDGIE